MHSERERERETRSQTLLVSGMIAWFAFIFSMLGLWRNCFTLLMEEGAEGSVVRLGQAIRS